MAYSGFIVRPFGKRTIRPASGDAPYEVDFDRVQRELIAPAMEAAGIRGSTTEVIAAAGNIREDMFQMLAHADLVVADISVHNANVFYELGARHALRDKHTYLIRYATGDEVPFDLKTDRYLAYPRAGVGSDAYKQLASAWCAENRNDTFDKLSKKQAVPENVCEGNPVAAQYELGQQLGVRGTPAIITQTGQMIPGYQSAQELMATLGLK